ncbi:MAG: hypothetical protein OES24_11910 [Acidimicrobiia bacterium]|nr:hypothetical protein [Acidimicrobiia bacterium]
MTASTDVGQAWLQSTWFIDSDPTGWRPTPPKPSLTPPIRSSWPSHCSTPSGTGCATTRTVQGGGREAYRASHIARRKTAGCATKSILLRMSAKPSRAGMP